MVTGSAAMISGRVADPSGERVDAIHLYRALNGNGVLDLGIGESSGTGADLPPPATFGGFSEYSAPTQMVTGSAAMISGRVANPTGERVDAIHLYRDLNGNGVIDLGIDQLLQADTTPADGYAFNAGSLPSGRHVLHVAAMKAGAVVGSSTTTLAAARWWSVAIGSRIHGEARFETTGDLVADPPPHRAGTAVTADLSL
jgi:hypothetical protein